MGSQEAITTHGHAGGHHNPRVGHAGMQACPPLPPATPCPSPPLSGPLPPAHLNVQAACGGLEVAVLLEHKAGVAEDVFMVAPCVSAPQSGHDFGNFKLMLRLPGCSNHIRGAQDQWNLVFLGGLQLILICTIF